jgi:hypothetical protein
MYNIENYFLNLLNHWTVWKNVYKWKIESMFEGF